VPCPAYDATLIAAGVASRAAKKSAIGKREPPSLACHDGRDPLADYRERGWFVQQTPVVVAVGVDEAGREHKPDAIVDRFAVLGGEGVVCVGGGHLGNDPALHPKGTEEAGAPRAIDHGGALDKEGLGCPRRGRVGAAE